MSSKRIADLMSQSHPTKLETIVRTTIFSVVIVLFITLPVIFLSQCSQRKILNSVEIVNWEVEDDYDTMRINFDIYNDTDLRITELNVRIEYEDESFEHISLDSEKEISIAPDYSEKLFLVKPVTKEIVEIVISKVGGYRNDSHFMYIRK